MNSKDDYWFTRFIELFMVDFILDRLGEEDQKIFLAKLLAKDGAVEFAANQISNFEVSFSLALEEKISQVLVKEADEKP